MKETGSGERSNAHAGNSGFEDEGTVVDSLAFADGPAAVEFQHLGDEVEAGRRLDGPTKNDVIASREAHETHFGAAAHRRVGAKLGSGFNHHDTGHEGPAGDVAADPKIVRGDVFKADDGVAVAVMDNAGEHFHFVAMGEDLADFFKGNFDAVEIDA
jgi:hypothetical protein